MKKLFLTLAFASGMFTVTAQEKPTKEQTVEFLNHYYELNQSSWECGTADEGFKSFKVNSITLLDSCKIKIKWRYDYSIDYEGNTTKHYTDYVTILEMNKVERLTVVRAKFDNCYLDYLRFTASPNNSFYVISKGVGFGGYEENTGNEMEVKIPIGKSFGELSDEEIKVKKAFNHLRKLCGAADPISFD